MKFLLTVGLLAIVGFANAQDIDVTTSATETTPETTPEPRPFPRPKHETCPEGFKATEATCVTICTKNGSLPRFVPARPHTECELPWLGKGKCMGFLCVPTFN
ncbi:hypothetical protein BIW11_14202 [Tropilaelaps mercedesae]|uniref:Uncharacterized protein n=1 Tax=Tropilaelaps mercedesae TaxID=418985 RepID=A0A1V9WYM2_9ACAR|nr:hypothetical protein BIW11_14202 [Tropilaelaps mercedesae]